MAFLLMFQKWGGRLITNNPYLLRKLRKYALCKDFNLNSLEQMYNIFQVRQVVGYHTLAHTQ